MRKLGMIMAAIAALGLVGYLWRPKPVTVDLAQVSRGPLRLTVRDDGRTRIRERYIVSTPVAGRLIRIDLKPGDAVSAGETMLAVIEPSDPMLLDSRSLAEAQARERAAQARLAQVEPRQQVAQLRLQLAKAESARVAKLAATHAVSQREVEEAMMELDSAQAEHSVAEFTKEIAQFELSLARAALMHTGQQPDYPDLNAYRFPIQAPVTGKVLRVFQESTTVLPAGAPLLELGDPTDLEIEVDVLSTDAVRIRPGARVYIEHWGGDQIIAGRVRLVEPSAFTKISALGIEEQRVNVMIDFDRDADLSTMGDGYRVEASIVVWEAPDVLKLPVGALFRSGTDWAVMVNQGGRASLRVIEIGHRNDHEAEVLSGLEVGEEVVVHPGDTLHPGSPLRRRAS